MGLNKREFMERLKYGVEIVKEAGRLTLTYFNNPKLKIDWKKDDTPVTEADRGAEQLLRDRIAKEFPDDAILGEEFSDRSGTSGYRWILDPIDGTKSFIHGVPLYSTLIGIEKEGEPIIGIIWIPALYCGVWAEKGKGAFEESPVLKEPIPTHVSETASFDRALFLTSSAKTFSETGRRELFCRMEKKSYLTRTWGDAYGYYLVATGRADLMIDAEMSPWDAGPLLTVLTEAGGRFSDWTGKPTIFGGDGVAANAALFDAIIQETRQFPKKSLEKER